MSRKTKTMDGNSAAAYVSYAFTDVAAIYPITPSSNMAEETDKMSVPGQKNLFGQEVKVAEMQSERGASRCRARFSCRRCPHHHLHRVSGTSSDDSQYV